MSVPLFILSYFSSGVFVRTWTVGTPSDVALDLYKKNGVIPE